MACVTGGLTSLYKNPLPEVWQSPCDYSIGFSWPRVPGFSFLLLVSGPWLPFPRWPSATRGEGGSVALNLADVVHHTIEQPLGINLGFASEREAIEPLGVADIGERRLGGGEAAVADRPLKNTTWRTLVRSGCRKHWSRKPQGRHADRGAVNFTPVKPRIVMFEPFLYKCWPAGQIQVRRVSSWVKSSGRNKREPPFSFLARTLCRSALA